MFMHKNLACSRRADRWDSAKRFEQKKKTTRGRGESEGTPSFFSSLFFSRSLPSRRTPLSESMEQANKNRVGQEVRVEMVSNFEELRPGKLSPGKLLPGKLRPGKLLKEATCEAASGFIILCDNCL